MGQLPLPYVIIYQLALAPFYTCLTCNRRWLATSLFENKKKEMVARSQDIEASETPAVKDLRTLFEQKARESPPVPSGSSHSGNSSAALLNPRQSVGRIPSPTPLYDPAEPLIPVKHDQSSLRKRPPPPPPSRAQKPQLGSPSPSISPLLHPTPDQSNASENHSPSSSVKQRLATRPPPPIPELRLDQNHSVDLNSEGSAKFGEPLVDLTGAERDWW
ncbi:hypothetical protein EDB86DRAFT_63755 [Lactarius hatsudake]|nr:hypothetical protein EDB86DRAFT_63755 [Lactarius hatsudake]